LSLPLSQTSDVRLRICSTVSMMHKLATPSLCAGWDVKTVAAHVVSTVVEGANVFLRLAIRRRSMARAIDELARRNAQLPAAEIAACLHRYADRPISPPRFGPLDPLADILVHSGDIRIALGLPFEPDVERVAQAMEFLTGRWPFGFVPLGRLRGVRLSATDISRAWGKGADIRGPVAALMMSACGRSALFHLLDGPGLPLLRHRLSDC